MYKSKIVAGSSTEDNLSGRRAKLWKALVRNCPEGLTWEETLWKDSVKNFCWKLLLILIMAKVRGLGVTLCGHGLREGRRTWMRQALFCIFLHFFASTLPYFCGTWCLVFEVWSGAEVIAWVSFLVFSHYLANIVYRDIKAISRDLYDIFVLITGCV